MRSSRQRAPLSAFARGVHEFARPARLGIPRLGVEKRGASVRCHRERCRMKPEVEFVLEHAGWPALLVDAGARFCARIRRRSRRSAPSSRALPLLSAIWATENGNTADQFLAQWERAPSPSVSLKFRVRGGKHRRLIRSPSAPARPADRSCFCSNCCPNPRPSMTRRALSPGRQRRAQAEAGLRAATGAVGGAGFQQRAHQRPRPHVAPVEQGRAHPSLAPLAHGGGEIRGQGGGNRQRPGHVQPSGKGARAPPPDGNLNQVVQRCVELLPAVAPGGDPLETAAGAKTVRRPI